MSTDPQSRSISELTRELTEQTSRLAQKEIELAKAELSAKGKQAGIGIGAFGGAGVIALLGKSKVEKAAPPVPEQTIETVKADVAEAKTRAQEGRA